MNSGKVLISGAGVAGPALAYWLRRYGFEPTVVERAPGPREGGQAIDIRGTAREVIDRMGLMDEIRAHHTGTHGITYLNRKGRRQGEMTADTFGHSGGVIADLEILRDDLVRILRDAAGDIEWIYGDMVTDLTEHADGVEVTFANGPARTFDIVVGADGMRSGVRRAAFGPDSHYITDLGYYTSYFTAHTDMRMDGWEMMYNLPAGKGTRGRVVMVYPVGDSGEVRVLLAFVCPEIDIDRHDLDARKALLARLFADGEWEIPGLLRQLPAADDVYFARVGAVKVDRWSSGRAVLLGDSAFGGAFGAGTTMAIAGSYVLAGELAAAGGDYRTAFTTYEKRMRPFVEANQQRPPGGVRGYAPRTRAGIWFRNTMMRALPYLPGRDTLMGGLESATQSLTLPDYHPARPVKSGIDHA